MKDFYVYAFVSKTDNKTVRYIGKGKGTRMTDDSGRRYRVPLKNRKKVAKGLTEQEAFNLERFLIALYGRLDLETGTLTNLTDGGEGSSGYVPTEETRAKMSAARLGVAKSEEHKANIAKGQKDKRWAGKQGAARRQAASERLSGQNNPMWGTGLQGPPRRKGYKYIRVVKQGQRIDYNRDMQFHGPPRSTNGATNPMRGKTGGSNPNARVYIVTDPEGVEHTVHGLTDWCKERGIKDKNLRNVLAGKVKCGHHKGYRISKP